MNATTVTTESLPATSIIGPLFVKVGNYDYCEKPHLTAIEVPTLAAASNAVRSWIFGEGTGSSVWCGGEVFDADGTCVAVVSYNGRVWEVGAKNPEGLHRTGKREFDLSA